ncbi:MAG: AAA family ATPase, partial [Methylocystis sp.]
LDALCLALFDKFPRVVSAGGGEGAPDASGETLTSGDPRIILRRGASAGYAEVDFAARDGQRYRARCDLLRARGNATGRLQNRLRSLWRLDAVGSSLQTIETGIEPVNRRIIELTDLTFDQFRRTALLSQGDFDAFLRADARERAELLEKITGVEIYAKISQRVFEEAREAQARVHVLENKRAEVGVLAEEARAETLREVAKTLELRQQCEGSYLETQNSLRQLELFDQAQRRLILAQQAQEEARCSLEVLEPKIAYL